MKLTDQQIKNFWSKVILKGEDDCWIWTASRNKTRGRETYGQVSINHRPYPAHRISYILATGNDPGKCKVMHTCDNPICVNPAHLVLGTHQDNMDDMKRKGRGGKKLTAEIATEIRNAQGTGTQREVADRFGVSHRTVGHIWNCQTWEYI